MTLRTARNAALSAGAQVTGKLATLAWTVLAVRMLDQADFGSFFYALTLGVLLSALSTWGFSAVMVQRASADLAALPALFALSMAWQLLVAVPLFVAAGAVAAVFRPTDTARIVLAVVFAAVLLEQWSETCRSAAGAAQDQRGTASALVVQRGCTAVLIIAALLAGTGVIGASVAFLLGSVVGVVTHARAMRALGVRLSRAAVTRPGMRRFAEHTWVLGLTALALMVLFRVDAVLLGALADDEAVASYAAAYRLLETVLFLSFALRSAVFPVMARTDEPELARRGVETALAALSLVYLPFAVVCLTETTAVLDLLYGEPYVTDSKAALRLLALAPLLYGLAYLVNAALQARRAFRAMLTTALAASAFNIALNLVLIPAYGGEGAATATTASYGVAVAYSVWRLRGHGVHLRLVRAMAQAAAASAVLAAYLSVSRLPLLLDLAVGSVGYLLLWGAVSRRWSPEHLAVIRGLAARRSP